MVGIQVIGLGVSAQAQLDESALKALQQASCVFGSTRQLETVGHLLLSNQQVEILPALTELENRLDSLISQNSSDIAILASGDPLFYGIGRWLQARFQNLTFHPAVSSIQAACHQLGLSLQDVTVVSLHGRPLPTLRRHLRKNRTLLVLTDQHSQPQTLARECLQCGFGESILSVCEALGYPQQRVRECTVAELLSREAEQDFDPLHVTVIHVSGPGGVLPEWPGIEDSAYETGEENGRGMISKRAVRLSILSWLQPTAGDVIWDLGAGCGGVAVELALWTPGATVYAVEKQTQRYQYLTANQHKFGVVDNLTPILGSALAVLPTLPAPDRIFIGGSGGELPALLEASWARLPSGGQLLVSAVTESTRLQLLQFDQQRVAAADAQRQTQQLSVSTGSELAGQLLYRPQLPVTLFQFVKTANSGAVQTGSVA